jgi:hypothetical protein
MLLYYFLNKIKLTFLLLIKSQVEFNIFLKNFTRRSYFYTSLAILIPKADIRSSVQNSVFVQNFTFIFILIHELRSSL